MPVPILTTKLYIPPVRDKAVQRTFHPCNDDDYVCILHQIQLAEQAVDAGDADIERTLYPATEKFGGLGGFLCDGQVRSASAGHQYVGIVWRKINDLISIKHD